MVCACSHRFVTAEAKPTSKRRGEGDRLDGRGDALGELNGLCVPKGDLGVKGVGGKDGDRAPPAAAPRLSKRVFSSDACSGRRPPEKSVPGWTFELSLRSPPLPLLLLLRRRKLKVRDD